MPEFKPYLTDEEMIQSQTMSHTLWSGGKTLEKRISFLKECLSHSNGELLNVCGIVEGKGNVIASLKRYYTELRIGTEAFPAIGLGAIFTEETKRRQGWAKKLIDLVIDEAKEEGYQALYLFSDIGVGYYAKFGFQPLRAENFEISVSEIPKTPSLSARLTTDKDTPWILKTYEARWNEFLRVHRDEKYWALFKELNSSSPIQILLKEGKPIGYTIFSFEKGSLYLEELCVPESDEPAALTWLSERAKELKASTIKGWYSAFHFKNTQKKITRREKSIPMVLFLNEAPNLAGEKTYFSGLDHF